VATTGQSKTAEQVARSYFEALGARDVDAALAHWRADGIEDVTPLRVYRGTDEIRGFLAALTGSVPDMETTVTRLTATERVAAVEWRIAGTFSGEPFEGIDPTGSHVELRGVDVLEVEGEEIVANTVYYDGAGFARAIGMLPKKDSGAERAMVTAFNGATKVRALVREQMDS
jgi:steroid delta-isomerase-like uncharacterized protein